MGVLYSFSSCLALYYVCLCVGVDVSFEWGVCGGVRVRVLFFPLKTKNKQTDKQKSVL